MSQYDQTTPDEGKLLTEDNEILDLQDFMESGVILATAVASPSPLNPIGEATIPTYEQVTPVAKKFINSDNEIYDFLQFLQSGNLKIQVTGSVAPTDATYITSTDETSVLPNSVQLLGTANQIAVTDGVLSFAPSLVLPAFTAGGDINLNTNSIVTPNGTNLRLAPGDSALDWIDLQSEMVNVLQSIIFNNAPTNNIFYNSVDHEFYFNANNERVLSLAASGISLGADLLIGTHKITSSSGTPIQLIPDDDADGIDLASSIVRVDQDIRHAGEENNKVSFTTGAQTHYIGGNSIYDINTSGFRLGMGYRVNLISNDASNVLDTTILTAYATQTAIANALIGANPFQGFWDASGGTFPTTESGGDPIVAGDWWRISVAGTLGGVPVSVGNQIFAIIDNPGQTSSNWSIINPRVYSVFGRTGTVVATSGDYDISQVTNGLSNALTQNYFFVGNGSNIATGTTPQAAMNILAGGVTSGQYMRGNGSNVVLSAIQAADVPTLNQNTTGQAGSVANALILNNSGSGAASGSTYNGSSAITLSYNSIGASPLAGSSSLTTVGTITSGTWQGTAVASGYGGTGLTSSGTSGNILVSTGTGWQSLPNVLPTAIINSSPFTLLINTSHALYSGSGIQLNLPTTAAVGSIINIKTYGSPTFTIAQAAGQQIIGGGINGTTIATTVGVTGTLASINACTDLQLECVVTNNVWQINYCNNPLLINGTTTVNKFVSGNSVSVTNGASGTVIDLTASASSAGKMLRANGSSWAASTATFADTYAVSTLLYAGSLNSVSGLATANNSMLTTNASGVPGWNAVTQYNVLSGGASGAVNNISPSTAGYVLTSNGASAQPTFQEPPVKSYGVFVPFLANKVISGTGFQTVVVTNSIYMETFNGTSQFEYYYYMYLKAGITYRFCFSAMTFSSAGIIQFAIKSDDAATTYNTLTSLDLYNNSTPNSFTKTQQTFTFSPSGYNNGDYVPCVLDVLCNSKNASSTNYIVGVFDPNGGFNFYEKYS